MASKFQATVVSNEYINAVADSAATGKPIAYSGVVASSTVFTDEQLKTLDYSGAQSANKEVTSVVTSSYLKQGSNTIVIEVNLSNENLSTDFQWASVLIYATYNGKNILVAVLRLVTPELFPAYDGKSIVSVGVDLFISVDKTAAANISVNGAGYATMDTVNKFRNYVDNDFNATIIRSDKDGVLNGSYSFSKAINALAGINGALNTRSATFTDFADVASNMKVYAGNWIVDSAVIANAPQGVGTSYIVTVVYGTWGKNGTIYISDYANDQFFYTSVDGIIKGWKKVADDKTVLHNTTDETADGIKTFIKQIIAQAGVKGNLQGNADTATKLATARKLGGQPFDGTSDVNLPGVNATGNQDTTGNAATATTAAGSDKLNTGRNISVTGDVTAPAQKFDGTKDVALTASLPAITRNDTSSNSSVDYGGTINVIDSVITDSKGRITGSNVSKISIPAQQTTVAGNAGTATKLQTARKIGGVSFDGTQDIDLAGVNKIGNQDTTGKAASADVLNTRYATFKDISVVTSDMFKYAGNWVIYSPDVKGMPDIGFGIMEVLPYTDNKTSGIIKISSTSREATNYIGVVENGSDLHWSKLADDSKLVHNTGSENVSGAKNFFDVLTALSGIKGDVTGSLKGNADTATKLATARKINGTLFDGTADINVNASNDTDIVHKSSNETIAGDKTFTGTNTFNNKIIAPAGVQGPMDLSQITIGGRNFFLNSRVLPDDYGVNKNATVTVEPFDSTTNMWHIVSPQNSGSNVGIYFWNYAGNKMATNTYWSYSADIKGTGRPTNFGFENGQHNTIVGNIGNDWSRISQTGYIDSNTKNIVMYFDTTNTPLDVYIKLPNLDAGNVPTDWTPAPEDVPSNDAQLVHKTGDETIGGSKTFSSTINGNLNGNSTTATKIQTPRNINGVGFDGTSDITVDPVVRTIDASTDLFTLANGFYYNNGVVSTNKPAAASNYFTVEVIQNVTNGFMRLIDNQGFSFSITKSASEWVEWRRDADESAVVHNYGDEFVGGTKKFTGTLVANNPIQGNTIRYNILDGYDLNGYKDTGDFVINGANNLVNYPDNASNYAVLHVEKVNDGTSIQTLTTVNNVIYTRVYGGSPASFGSWVSVADDKNVVHNWGNETVYGDKTLTGNTGLNTVTTTKQQDTKITVAGISMHFIETSLGVNVLMSGKYGDTVADGKWKNIGTLPSNITKPLMPVVMNNSDASGIYGVSFREGFTLFIRITETGSIDARFTTFKSNDNKQYTSYIVVDTSTNWIK